MNTCPILFHGADLVALPSGALHWPDERLLVVSDLHLGKATRQARWGGAALPPYECRDTLDRLAADLEVTGARRVIALGDSFDAPGLDQCLPADDTETLLRLQAGRDWTWVTGNHDPGPLGLPGAHLDAVRIGPLILRHIAQPDALAEVSGHYHPKARLALRGRMLTRPCFLWDAARLILPAYGTYTGGLFTDSAELSALMTPGAQVALTGRPMIRLPMPRRAQEMRA